jgi:mono/diheme cytochrome c family protein
LTEALRAAKPLRVRGRIAALLMLVGLSAACGDDAPLTLAEQGRRVYQSNCIACHHTDPARDGSMGPPLACSSAELIEARVLRAEYPPGYKPKRDSKLMPAQPFLRPDLPGLAAYLACP